MAIKIRYGVQYCTICNFPAQACKGHPLVDTTDQEAAARSIQARIAEVKRQAGKV